MNLITNLLCAFLGTLGFTILFNVQKRFYFCCGITGMAGWACYLAVTEVSSSPAVASFFGSLVVVLLSRVFAVWKKCPITVFLISGIFPLIPGSSVYYTAYYLVTNSLEMAAVKGLESVKIAFAIVAGIIFVVSIPKEWFQLKYWRARRKGLK